jgi:hypothetical protein
MYLLRRFRAIMNPNIPQYVPSSTSERTKSIQTNPDSDIDMSCDALDTIPGPLAVPACEGDLGFGGRFSTCKPDHVVLETLDGTKLSISKSALSHSRSVIPPQRVSIRSD